MLATALPALIVFGILLAICLFGLSVSNRAADRNDASRRASGQPNPDLAPGGRFQPATTG